MTGGASDQRGDRPTESGSAGERLRQEAQRIIDSGALGRSPSYARLLSYLVERTVEGRAPKELEIAAQVFGKGSEFDPTQDAMVRVYAHNLRQKLQNHYSEHANADRPRLIVPRGEYRVQLASGFGTKDLGGQRATADTETAEIPETAAAPGPDTPRKRMQAARIAAALAFVGFGVGLGFGIAQLREPGAPALREVLSSPAWAPLLDDDLPILVVVGDYYIFGERDSSGEVSRLVRDFDINSRKDLDDLMLREADARGRFLDLALTYLPAGSAFALRDVFYVADTHKKAMRVASMSELSAAELKTGHVVYVGYVSGLGMLEDFVFASSGLAVGFNYDELRNAETGTSFVSEAGIPGAQRNYRDYGLVSTFPGPTGNQVLVIAGTRDTGLMQAAQVLSDSAFLQDIEKAASGTAARTAPAFELLYEVTGYGRTNLDAMLVHSGQLSYRSIWGGERHRDLH